MQQKLQIGNAQHSLGSRLQKFYFNLSYRFGFAEWDVNKPQPDLIRLVEEGKIAGKTILDIGCGSGDNAIYLAQKGFQVTGLDYSDKGIEVAKRRAAKENVTVKFDVADAFNLSNINQQFDIVIDYGLYHNIDMDKMPLYLENIRQVLKTGGQFIIQAFGEKSPKQKFAPRQVSETEIRNEFSQNWTVLEIREAVYHATTEKQIHAILAIIQKI
ncbi:class I SAM-dependent methyltransferase [Persicitalea sp.]|uniref:class I SAM-dependent methyltransferase n=1 Tax=Persicitalea sp. TaxID=3100273 RepID=UPI003593809B